MIDQQVLLRLIEKCDIYFEGSLISQELIIQKYANFFVTSINSEDRSSSVAIHTGSICFDIMSLIIATIACILMDQTDPVEIISSLADGDMILYKNERYRWRGLETMNGMTYMKLEQDGRGKNGLSTKWCPLATNKGLVKPYNGTSDMTDGRGIRRKKTNRSDFISYITGKEISDIPSITGISAVIVTERTLFDRIQRGIRIDYDEGKSIRLLDIVPASYYSDSNEPYQFGSNPSKEEPVLKIAGKVSIARDLVLDKYGNRVVGLIVIGSDSISKGSSELEDLIHRKSLKFTHVTMSIHSENTEYYIGEKESFAVFACTKKFLLRNSMPTTVKNPLTFQLEQQIHNIINNEVTIKIIDGGCSWHTYQKIRNALFAIKQSEWDDEHKKNFIVLSYSIFNLFTTAVFSMGTLEQMIVSGKLQFGVSSPFSRIQELKKLVKCANSLELQCAFIVDALENLYKSIFTDSPKCQVLKQLILRTSGEKVAIIIPKSYYAEILYKDTMMFSRKGVYITTANQFDDSQSYDKIIVVGDFSGKHFDALKCKAASDIIVLLYECEIYWFEKKRQKAEKFEKKLNTIMGLVDNYSHVDSDGADGDEDMIGQFARESLDLEEYIDSISVFDIQKFTAGVFAGSGNASVSEVSAMGRFTGGELIMFSKYYKAVVYNPLNTREPISETDIEKLSAGDRLIFAKRDDFTRNIVDNVYEALLISKKLSREVLDATEKAKWWKEVLRNYQKTHNLSYRQLAKELNYFGCSLTEVSIRKWLVEESYIVGPREESTLQQIAEMTKDTYLLNDTSGCFNACKMVRRQRKKILKFIGKAIEYKLSGHQPTQGSELEIVYNNVENLSEMLELETMTLLDESIWIPTNITNKPISDMEGIS
ncbi:DrmE family protein [Lacrimispora sp.]|uniref:DrmE family protein n=1 Tax=Lacrimispora sp. TaxID=2719234 RepID=UPI002FD8FCDC